MNDYWGIRIVESPFVPDGCGIVFGRFDKPDNWTAMTEDEQLTYAIAHGAIVLVNNVGRLSDG